MNTYVKFKTNIAEIITFKFNLPKEFDSQYGKVYSYGVEWKGVDAYLSATKILSDKLQAIGNLQGQTLMIEKVEGDNSRKYWVIKDAQGNDITPSGTPQATQQGFQPQNNTNIPQPQNNDNVSQLKQSIREAFVRRDQEIETLRTRVEELTKEVQNYKTLLIEEKGEEAVDLHGSMSGTEKIKIDDEVPIV